MIRSYVYYHGPLTAFTQKPHRTEVIAEFRSRWVWLAYARATAALKNLNANRCGLRVEDELTGKVLRHSDATTIEVSGDVVY